jgi:hypothetical protein
VLGRRTIERQLVWIFGSPRSGSTWLLSMLNEHPRVVPVDEPLIGLHLAPFVADRPGSFAEDLDIDNFSFNRLAAGGNGYFFSERFRSIWQPLLGDLIRGRFAPVARRSGSRSLLVIKEPNGSQAADMILRALPRSRLLFLLRDGRDVVDSEVAAFMAGSWMSARYPMIRGIEPQDREKFVVQAAYKWGWQTEVVQQAFAEHPGPKLLMRYEDLLIDTATHLGDAFEWLGLEVGETELAGIAERHSFGQVVDKGALRFHRAARPGDWRQNLSAAERALVEDAIGAQLEKLGYE